MLSFDDIRFDPNYAHCTNRCLLLNDEWFNHTGPMPHIPLRHAPIFTYIQFWDRLLECYEHIHHENRKLIQLVISAKSFSDLDANIPVTEDHIMKVWIFCHSFSSYLTMKRWNGRYQNRIGDVCLPHKLDWCLLKLGLDCALEATEEYRHDSGVYENFAADGRRLAAALADYFQGKADGSSTDATS